MTAGGWKTCSFRSRKPELFFVLRGIKIDDFVGRVVKRESAKMLRKAASKSGRVIEAGEGDISRLFGITMDGAKVPDGQPPPAAEPVAARKRGRPGRKKPGGTPRCKPGELADAPKLAARSRS